MARVPQIRSRGNISQVAPLAVPTGQAWAALAEIASVGEDLARPAALKEASEAGARAAVYRDEKGQLKVQDKSLWGGELANAYNTAAYAKFLSQRTIDRSETFTELAIEHQFNPAGFKDAADAYVAGLRSEEGVPELLREEVAAGAEREAAARFNGLVVQRNNRDQAEANTETKAHRDMLADDYINLVMAGNEEEAAKIYSELEILTRFRANAPYIGETPAASEAYLRGVRGAAKAASLTKMLEDLGGASEIGEDTRAEIDAILEDPDLDPGARAKLYAATQGRLKGIDGRAIADRAAADNYAAKVFKVEAGNRVDAKNPLSSAFGPHQFLKGTWRENVRELLAAGKAEWARGLGDTELLAMRGDMAASTEVFEHFRAKNAAVLRNAGMPVTDATEYLAHFLGPAGAVAVLKADPTLPVVDVIGGMIPGFAKQNPSHANMTVAGIINWAGRKMSVKASDLAAQRAFISETVEDEEVRKFALEALNDHIRTRQDFEAAAAGEYETRLASEGDTLTEYEILTDHDLSDADQAKLVRELQKQRGLTEAVSATLQEMNDPGAVFDIYDTKTRNRVDSAFQYLLGDEDPMSERGQTIAATVASRSGVLPKTMFNALRAGVAGNDPERFAASMEYLGAVLDEMPGAVDPHSGSKGLKDLLADYRFYSGFRGAQKAAEAMIEARDRPAPGTNLKELAKDYARRLEPREILDHFAGLYDTSVTFGDGTQQSAMMDEYTTLFLDAFLSTGDADLAKNRALTDMARIYGPNMVTGSSRVMRFPPQNYYPRSNSNPQWMRNQVVAAVEEVVGVDERPTLAEMQFNEGERFEPRVDVRDILLVSDEETAREVHSGKPPSYRVKYLGPDGLQMLPGRFFFEKPPESPVELDTGNLDLQRRTEAAVRNLRLWREHLRDNGMTENDAFIEVTDNRAKYAAAPPPGSE